MRRDMRDSDAYIHVFVSIYPYFVLCKGYITDILHMARSYVAGIFEIASKHVPAQKQDKTISYLLVLTGIRACH
jgi:hypothetical protein